MASRLPRLFARPLFWILLVAVLLRVVGVAVVGDRELAYEFGTLTHNLLADRGYVYFSETADGEIVENALAAPAQTFPSAYMPPLYPMFLYAITSVVGTSPGGVVAVELVQVGLGVLSCTLMFLIGRAWMGERTGLLAAAGFAVFPLIAFMPSQISAAGLFVAVLLGVVWLLIRAGETGRIGWYILAGLAFGMGVLARAQFILFLPAVWIWLWTSRSERRWTGGALLTVCVVLVLTPWTVRNSEVLGVATPLTTSGGFNLWQAYNPSSTGTHTAYTVPAYTPPSDLTADLEAIPHTSRYEVEIDSVYKSHALDAIQSDPSRVVPLAAKKLWLYWGHFGGSGVSYPGAQSPLFWGPWWLALPFFVLGLWRSLRENRWREHSFLYLYLMGQTAVVIAFFVLPRYRLEILPVVLLFAAYGAETLIRRWRSDHPHQA